MTYRKEWVERRKHKRFHIPRVAFVALAPVNTKLGQVIDISMGGLAFRYIGGKKPSKRSTELRIFTDNDFCLDEVPFETISDFETYQIPFTSIIMRRSGVHFGQLTQNQRSRLEYFIQKHAIHAVAY